jgi:hypothetical protein
MTDEDLEPCPYQIQHPWVHQRWLMGLLRLKFWCNWTPTTQQIGHPFGSKPWWQMLHLMMYKLGTLYCIPWDLYWTFGRKLLLIDLGGNQDMDVKLNSMSNILHKVLDQLGVLPCWLDLPTNYLRGWGYLKETWMCMMSRLHLKTWHGNNHLISPWSHMIHHHCGNFG